MNSKLAIIGVLVLITTGCSATSERTAVLKDLRGSGCELARISMYNDGFSADCQGFSMELYKLEQDLRSAN